MKNLLFTLFFIFAHDALAAAGGGRAVDPDTLGDTYIPSRLVRIEAPDGKVHYLMGSKHDESVEDYIPNPVLRLNLFQTDRYYDERVIDIVHELTWRALRELNEESKPIKVKGKTWLEVLMEDDEDSDDEEMDEVFTRGKAKIEAFLKPRESILKNLREDWGIAYTTMLVLWKCWDNDALDRPEIFDLNEKEISVIKRAGNNFEFELSERYKKHGKTIGGLETTRSFFQDTFEGLSFITDEYGKEDKSEDYQFFIKAIVSMLYTLGQEETDTKKSAIAVENGEKTYETEPDETVSKTQPEGETTYYEYMQQFIKSVLPVWAKEGVSLEETTYYEYIQKFIEYSFPVMGKEDTDPESTPLEVSKEKPGAKPSYAEIVEDSEEDEEETIFSPKNFIWENHFIYRGLRKRDTRMVESMKKAMDGSDETGLFVVGAKHVFGMLTKLSPWLEEKGYKFSFIRKTDRASGYEFVEAALNAAGDAYEYVG